MQAANNTDWELNMLRHDADVIAEQTERILKEPWRYNEYNIEPPKKENGGKLCFQLLVSSEDTVIPDEEMSPPENDISIAL